MKTKWFMSDRRISLNMGQGRTNESVPFSYQAESSTLPVCNFQEPQYAEDTIDHFLTG